MAGTIRGGSVAAEFTPITASNIRMIGPNTLRALDNVMYAQLEAARKQLAKEPPERPKQTYKRTHAYSAAWRIVPAAQSANGRVYTLENNVVSSGLGAGASAASIRKANARGRVFYAKYVGGRIGQQAAIHAGRWKRIDEVLNRDQIMAAAQAAIIANIVNIKA